MPDQNKIKPPAHCGAAAHEHARYAHVSCRFVSKCRWHRTRYTRMCGFSVLKTNVRVSVHSMRRSGLTALLWFLSSTRTFIMLMTLFRRVGSLYYKCVIIGQAENKFVA